MTDHVNRLAVALEDRYVIERELGQGGMATVYLAHDVKHERKVALKVLRPELAAVLGAERFVQEIKTTAALQHPHILPLFDSGRTGGQADGRTDEFLYYVMPYIEGETLREKLNRETQLGVDEAVRITREVADALDAAHRQGVVHRDIKPENILITDGRPLVADFGIALAVSAAAGGRMTETGLSLGTPHYMSPEQATADKEITARSDIYSLGSVLYEMLTGEPPHMGNSAQAIIMKIVTEEAQSVTKLRKSVPPNVTAAVAKALEKLPADRFATAKAFGEALGNPAFTTASAAVQASGSGARGPRPLLWPIAAALAVAVALLGWLRPAADDPATTRQWIGLSAIRPGGALPSAWPLNLAIAPDGSAIVFTDSVGPIEAQLFIKERSSPVAEPLAGTSGGSSPFFSPDGQWIGFATKNGLFKVPRGGGPAALLSDSARGFFNGGISGGAWLDDGTVVFPGPDNMHLLGVDQDGGLPRPILDAGRLPPGAIVRLSPLPGARVIVISVCMGVPCTQGQAWALDLERDSVVQLLRGVSSAWYLPTGHLLYGRSDGSLFIQRLERGGMAVTGAPVPVLSGLGTFGGVPAVVVSAAGTALFAYGGSDMFGSFASDLIWIDRSGAVTVLDSGLAFAGVGQGGIALSPDGTRLALVQAVDGRGQIFVKGLPDGPISRLTFEGQNFRPAWTPDGGDLLYIHSDESGVVAQRRRGDGTGSASVVVAEERWVQEVLMSPDGQWLVYRTDNGAPGRGDILARGTMADTTIPLLATSYEEASPALAPDGRWLAYSSNEGGRHEVFVRPFPDVSGGKWQVSRSGGTEPHWGPDGRELFYRSSALDLVVATVETTPAFRVTGTTTLFSTAGYLSDPIHPTYAVARDGRRFVFVRNDFDSQIAASRLILVENWFSELRPLLERH